MKRRSFLAGLLALPFVRPIVRAATKVKTYFWGGGEVYEVLVYDRKLSKEEQASVTKYLAAKYGVVVEKPEA